MALMKVTMTVTYEVPDDHGDRIRAWGSADMVDMAKVDEMQFRQHPEHLVEFGSELESFEISVEPVE